MGYFDRKWRRTKVVGRKNWAKRLMNPLTFKALVSIGIVLTRFLWVAYRLYKAWRE